MRGNRLTRVARAQEREKAATEQTSREEEIAVGKYAFLCFHAFPGRRR